MGGIGACLPGMWSSRGVDALAMLNTLTTLATLATFIM